MKSILHLIIFLLFALGEIKRNAEQFESKALARIQNDSSVETARLVAAAVKETQEKFAKKFEEKKQLMQEITQKEIEKREIQVKELSDKLHVAKEKLQNSSEEVSY